MGRSRHQQNKPHKTKFASKSSRNAHRVSDKGRIVKPSRKSAAGGGRAVRLQRSKAIQDQKDAAVLKKKQSSTGDKSAPRVIVVFGLSSSVDISLTAEDLLRQVSGEDDQLAFSTVASQTYGLRITVLQAPYGDLLSCMEMAKIADLLAFVVSANSLYDGTPNSLIDDFGAHCLSVFRSMGLPSTAVLIRDLPSDVRVRQHLKKAAVSCLASELPEDCKFHLAQSKEDLQKFLWLFKEKTLSPPNWRCHRSYVISQEVCGKADDDSLGRCTLIVPGYVHAHNISVNQLVHVSGVGDFQLSKIDVLKDPFPLKDRKSQPIEMETDALPIIDSLTPDTAIQEPLLVENIPDPLAGEQTWPTEEEMAEANVTLKLKRHTKKLSHGTSDYQAAWIVDSDNSDEDAEKVDLDENEMVIDEGTEYSDVDGNSHYDLSLDEETMGGTEMADDETLTKEQIEAGIKRLKEENADDEEYPDEVDTPIDVAARKRFARYRGLKSFRTSTWDPKESLPPEYARIFAFDNFARTQKLVISKVKEFDEGSKGCACVGSYVRLWVKNFPSEVAEKLCNPSRKCPVVVSGLLQHESKMSVLHFSIKKHDSYESPIKSKDLLIFHVGFRQFVARPIFSSDDLNCDKHKMERFLHRGRFSIASVYAPISFPPMPLIALKNREGDYPAIAAVGSLKSVNPDRIILKKIVLTGYPQRVSKMKAIVRYMFHNPQDVRWFKPVEVRTKNGFRGRIKEPVGTHGAMKCIFNNAVQQHDTVCMSLYKRAYPKWPEQIYQV